MRAAAIVVVMGLLALMGLALSSSAPVIGQQDAPQLAKGVVYHDKNGNRQRDADEPGLPNVRVSNGVEITSTNANGEYELTVSEDAILFVIKPRGWQVPMNEYQLPQFYYIHKPQGSPQSKYPGVAPTGPLPASVDFALHQQEEPQEFKAILFGDTQPRDQKEVDWISHDIIEEIVEDKVGASFGVTLGDISFDNLEMFDALNHSVALIGIPWYNVIGNHDINYDAKIRKHANETYERVYGPSWYSFDYGPTHFIVLDDIEWRIKPDTGKGYYVGGLGPDQMQFIKNDLAMIPADQMVVLMMHIPLIDVEDRTDLYRLIEQRPFCLSISGHEHYHEHVWITKADGWEGPEPHHHIINVTACGSWWSGAPDERGIPHTTMSDGAPNGYSIISFNGTDYRLDFKAAGRPADHQLEIDTPEVIPVGEVAPQLAYVNVFNGSQKTVVEMRVGGQDWVKLEQVREADPKYVRTLEREKALLKATPDAFRKLPDPTKSSHLWKGELPTGLTKGLYELEVKATDHWGREYFGTRTFRVE